MHASAKCYLQARADAQAAVAALSAALRGAQAAEQERAQSEAAAADEPSSGKASSSSSAAGLRFQLALAYRRLGDACLAEKDHPDRSSRLAAKAFMRAAELLGPGSGGRGGKRSKEEEAAERAAAAVQDGLQEASEELTVEELSEVRRRGLRSRACGGGQLV